MSGFFKKWLDKAKMKANLNYIAPNETFVVKIVGWNCKENAPVKRDAMSVNVNITEVYRSFDPSNPNLKMVTMPLGNLTAGTYTVSLSIGKRNLTSVSVVDYSGGTYGSTILADGSISFALTEDTEAVSVIGITTDADIKVQYHAQTTIGATTTQTSASPTMISTPTTAATASSKSGAEGRLDPNWWVVRIIIIGLVGFATA
ncbi:hypothetical protein B0J14DRAFT_566443 [Halenospora varia]|nr:hypothetical protein B0J14DRAFT_566443 [Halenospora varia]